MILCDQEITNLCLKKSLISPYNKTSVNPCSYDLMLGEHYISDSHCFEPSPVRQKFGKGKALLPGEFILTEVDEIINVPTFLVGKIALKSSAARMGIGHLMAGFVDAGYSGRLTLELKNYSRYHTISLYGGMKIVQIVFHRMSSIPDRPYGQVGHYQNDDIVSPSKIKL